MLSFTEALTYKGGGIIRYLYDKVTEMDDRHEEAGITYKTTNISLQASTDYKNGSWSHNLGNITFACPMPLNGDSDNSFDFKITAIDGNHLYYKYKSSGETIVKLTAVKMD